MLEKIKVVVKEPLKTPYVKEIDDSLEIRQELVGGYIEYVPLENYNLFLNEEGKLKKLIPNLKFPHDIVVGTIFVSKSNEEGEDVDLTDNDISEVMGLLRKYSIVDKQEVEYFSEIINNHF